MCSPAKCRQCNGVTWSGCGSHVDQVMAGVPADKRCTCNGRASTPQPTQRRGLFRR